MPKTLADQVRLFTNGQRDELSQADCYFHGRYVEKDLNMAEMLYKKSVAERVKNASYKLGVFYQNIGRIAEAAQTYFNAFLGGYRENAKEALIQLGLPAKNEYELRQSLEDELDKSLLESKSNALPKVPFEILAESIDVHWYLGQIFESEGNWKSAEASYEIALVGRHGPEAMYHLGALYEAGRMHAGEIVIKQDESKAYHWYQSAAIREFDPALSALEKKAHRNALAALFLAPVYGLKSRKNALGCYFRSSDLGNGEAALRLGEIYEKGELGVVPDQTKAGEFYLLSAKRKYPLAFVVLEDFVHKFNTPALQYQLAEVYEKNSNDIGQALKWYKKSVDQGYLEAKNQLTTLASSDPDFAYAAGYLYETDPVGTKDLQKAFFYYSLALRNGHEEARAKLESQAESGNAEAEYALGYYYYAHQEKSLQAVNLCVKAAEQRHKKASDYLKNTPFTIDIYLELAARYKEGRDVKVNINQAIAFYDKANLLKNSEAPFHLAKIYEAKRLKSVLQPNSTKVHDLYLLAAQRGHKEALIILKERANQSTDSMLKYEIAQLYHTSLKQSDQAVLWYKKSADQGYPEAENQLIALGNADPECAYAAGFLYETNSVGTKGLQKAYFYYALATRNKHREAQAKLESQVELGDANAEYALGYYYYAHQAQPLQAVNLCVKAAEQGHKQAADYLKNTSFTVDVYLELAARYQEGRDVKVNIDQAIAFYNKAKLLKNSDAPFHLAKIYEASGLKSALDLYLLAAQRGHKGALSALTERADQSKDSLLEHQIAHLYYADLKENDQAARWYKKSEGQQYSPARYELVEIAETNAEFAYAAGRIYEVPDQGKPDLEKAFFLYALATRNGHEAAKKLLESRAESGMSEAQYMLGFEVYGVQKNITLAVKWCMRAAEKGYAPAQDYLRKTNFDLTTTLEIARQYEQGLGVKTNIQSAIYFYTRAHQLKDKSAALKLGHLYANSAEGKEENLKKACEYYIVAAESGYLEALDPLEVLAETAPSDVQLKIAGFYRKMAANRPDQALIWQLKAAKEQVVASAKAENSAVFFNSMMNSAASRKGAKATDLTAKINHVALGVE